MATPIPALSVFGATVERFENYEGDFDVLVTLDAEPGHEEAGEFVDHLQQLLRNHLGGLRMDAAAAQAAYAAALDVTLSDLAAMTADAAERLEGGFLGRMELLGLGVLLRALAGLEPGMLADWWRLYAESGGDPLRLLDALEATTL